MRAAARRSVRCAIYTRVSTRNQASIKTSTRSMPNMMQRRLISAVRPMPVGHWFAPDMAANQLIYWWAHKDFNLGPAD